MAKRLLDQSSGQDLQEYMCSDLMLQRITMSQIKSRLQSGSGFSHGPRHEALTEYQGYENKKFPELKI